MRPHKDLEMEDAQKYNKYVVLVPFPLQGHMTPMLQLASILQRKGFSIILAHTKFNGAPNPANRKDFILLPIGETVSDVQQIDTLNKPDPLSVISGINSNHLVPLEEGLGYFIKQNPHRRVCCIIHDELMYCASDVGSRLNLPNIILHTASASFVLSCRAILRLYEDGRFPCQDSLMLEPASKLHSIRFKELWLVSKSFGDLKRVIKLLQSLYCEEIKPSAVIWNSMEHLELQSLEQFQKQHQVPSFAIGPLHKIAPTIPTSFLSEDADCLRWLDSQAKNSVLYVSIGSLASMEPNELKEMAWGLANSEQPFLWVLRPGSVTGSDGMERLPESFKETVGDRGCIVKWSPQREVLAHDSVGGFWSHCGWNSTLESICEGIPIVCRPQFGDQLINARYLIHEWKIGLELEDVLDRHNIEKSVRRLMQEAEGEQMRQRASSLRGMAQQAMAQGGTSYNSLNSLAELISSL